MSHELRTPRNSLLILARLLADNPGGKLDAKQVKFAQTIHGASLDLLWLINDLLDLAKIESGAVTALNVAPARFADLRDDLERNFRQLALDKGLEFAISIDPALPPTLRVILVATGTSAKAERTEEFFNTIGPRADTKIELVRDLAELGKIGL